MSATAERQPSTPEALTAPKVESKSEVSETDTKVINSIEEKTSSIQSQTDAEKVIRDVAEAPPPPSIIPEGENKISKESTNINPELYQPTNAYTGELMNVSQNSPEKTDPYNQIPNQEIDSATKKGPEFNPLLSEQKQFLPAEEQYKSNPDEQTSVMSEEEIRKFQQEVKPEQNPEYQLTNSEYTIDQQQRDYANLYNQHKKEFAQKEPMPQDANSPQYKDWERRSDIFADNMSKADINQKKLENEEKQKESPQQTEKEKKEQEEKERRRKDFQEIANRLAKEIAQKLNDKENLTPEQKKDLKAKIEELQGILDELDSLDDNKNPLLALVRTLLLTLISTAREALGEAESMIKK